MSEHRQAEPWPKEHRGTVAHIVGRKGMQSFKSDAEVGERARVLRWMGHDIRTRTGKSRRWRVADCGSLYAARQGATLGTAHRWCRDRMCPGCMRRRQAERSKYLHAFVGARLASGRELLFVTLTQVKQDIAHESAAQALSRLHATRRAMWNTHTAEARELRAMVPGGVFFTELAWSYKGKERRDGSRVTYSGWHAHLHGLVEISAPPDGFSRAQWRNHVRKAIVRAWMKQNPEGSRDAQCVVELRKEQAGQVCKYPLKPFDHRTPVRQREACLALNKRRTNDAFGSWRSWSADGLALVERDAEAKHFPSPSPGIAPGMCFIAGEVKPPREPIELGDVSLWKLQQRADWGARVYFGRSDVVGVDALTLLRSVRKNPKSLQRRAREKRRAGKVET